MTESLRHGGSTAVRWVVIVVLTLATIAMLGVSMVLNYFYFSSYGQTPSKQLAFGILSVIADIWKAFAPVVIYELWRTKHRRMALLGALVWLPCIVVAMSSALGLLATDRMALTGSREIVRAGFADVTRELEEVDSARKNVRAHRSLGEIDAAIATVLARPVGRSTVSALSTSCTNVNSRTADACAEVATLREERATAIEADRLDARLTELRRESKKLRDGGGTLASDPLADLYQFLSRGALSAKDVSFWLVFVVAVMGEMLSAFGFALVGAFAHATRSSRTNPDMSGLAQVGRAQARFGDASRDTPLRLGHESIGDLMLYFSECTELTSGNHAVDAGELHADYEGWCRGKGEAPLTHTQFCEEFDRLRERPEVRGKIRRFGTRYYGLRLVRRPVALPSV